MLLYIAVLSALGALGTTLYWWSRRVDVLGRRRPFPQWSVALLAVVAVGAAVPVIEHAREENTLARVAGQLAGAQVSVHCQSFGETFVQLGPELGYVKFGPEGTPEHHTVLKYEVCRNLSAYQRSSKAFPSLSQVTAVHVLTHESMHMRGITNEAFAECAAVQRDARTAELLGASEPDAVALAQRYWRSVYPNMPAGYQSGDCHPGGALDERLPDAPW